MYCNYNAENLLYTHAMTVKKHFYKVMPFHAINVLN